MTEKEKGRRSGTVVVTAAAGGIGGALVRRLARRGYGVYACDISGRRLDALKGALGDATDRVTVCKADVGNPAAAQAIAEAASTQLAHDFGPVFGLANVAGGIVGIGEDVIDRPLEKLTVEELEQSYRLNLHTAFLMIKALLPLFEANGYAKVANVASLAAFGNFDLMGNAAYDAAKAGVIGLTRSLSRSLGPRGVRVNVVAPGSVYTEKVREVFNQDFIDRQENRIPLRRMPGPDDVAAVLEYLLMPESDLISGEVVRVGGGLR